MDAINLWAVSFVNAHPHIATWLMIILAVDQVLKTVKNALKLNISDNVFDTIGDVIGKILAKVTLPKQ